MVLSDNSRYGASFKYSYLLLKLDTLIITHFRMALYTLFLISSLLPSTDIVHYAKVGVLSHGISYDTNHVVKSVIPHGLYRSHGWS